MTMNENSPPALPRTAKTLIYDLPTKTLHLHPSVPIPTPNPTTHDHLVRVHATALCARELAWPFEYPDAIFSENPDRQLTPGYDVTGTVVGTPPPGSPFHAGDEIYARTLPSRPGNCREYTVVRTGEMALKPAGLGWAEAASVPLSAVTAWQALFVHGGFSMGNWADEEVEVEVEADWGKKKRVLVTAAAGGVGVWLVQLARIAGLEVVAQVGSEENDRFVRALGAVETVNYRTTSLREWAEAGKMVDTVVDLVGGKTLEDAWFCVKDGGALVGIFEPPEARRPAALEGKDVRNLFFIMKPDGEQLGQVSRLLSRGRCRPVVDSVWKLEEYEKAFERLDGGHAKGKVVVKIY